MMWHSDDKEYRILFRYEKSDWTPEHNGRTGQALCAMFNAGKIEDLMGQANPCFSEKLLHGIEHVVVALLQKRITEGDLHAWKTMAVGYAFHQKKDVFNKKEGRRIAFGRALDRMPKNEHWSVFAGLFTKHVIDVYPFDQ